MAISIEQDLDRRIRETAKRLNQPVSWFIRNILEEAMAAHQGAAPYADPPVGPAPSAPATTPRRSRRHA